MTFKALLAAKTGEKISTSVVEMNEQDLMPGDVTVAVDYSTVNYKDALAISGRTEVIRQFPLIPGIDLAGTVEASSYPGIAVGDRVVANSWGLSQTHHGGYAQRARLKGEWLVKIPAPFSTKDAMAIGTAGYTAMLSVLALEHGGITPQRGDILVQVILLHRCIWPDRTHQFVLVQNLPLMRRQVQESVKDFWFEAHRLAAPEE